MSAQPVVNVATVIDGSWERNEEVESRFREEILALTRGEFDVRFPAERWRHRSNPARDRRAVVEAAQRRLRPILLTTATTIGGLIPLYLGGGPMWEPMAIAIMFGLALSTVLTLGFVPLMYTLLYRVSL